MLPYNGNSAPVKIGYQYAVAKYGAALPEVVDRLNYASQTWEFAFSSASVSYLSDGFFGSGYTLGMNTGAVIFIQSNDGYSAVAVNTIDSFGVVSVTDALTYLTSASQLSYYFFHGYAGNQVLGNNVFIDFSGNGNNAVPGANLPTDATGMYANAGYITTAAPGGGLNNTCLRCPNLNFNWVGGEKIFVILQTKFAKPAANKNIFGDGYGTSSSQRGIAIQAGSTAGGGNCVLYGATAKVGIATVNPVFDGTLHSYALFMDGETKTYAQWVDAVIDPPFFDGYKPFYQADVLDTVNSNTLNIGSSAASPGSGSDPIGGAAVPFRMVFVYRMPKGYAIPSITTATSVIKWVLANPGQRIPAGML